DRFDFRPEVEPLSNDRVVKGLDAHTVSRQQQRTVPAIPYRDPEHAAQACERILAPLFVGVNDRFGVAVGVEAMTPRDQFCSKLGIVMNFAIEDDPDRAVFVLDWLLAGRQIDDREPPHTECYTGHDAASFVVRTTVADRSAHPPKSGIGVAGGVAA